MDIKRKLVMLPGPTNVPDRVTNAMLRPMINHRADVFAELLKQVTEKSKYLFQTTQDAIVLSASGTGGVEAAVWNIVRPGDSVVVPVFGEFSERLAEVVELAGGTALRVKSELGSTPSLDSVKAQLDQTKDLKALFIVHNETSSGCTVQYLREVCKIASDKGAFVVVDAISSLGGYAIPVDSWGIDICVTGSQKCLAAPPGLALLSVSRKVVEYTKRTPPRVRYFDLARQLEYLSRGETPFTPALSLYYALDEALSMLMEEGLEKRVERHGRLASKIYRAVSSLGLKPFPEEPVRSNTVIATVYPTGIEDRQLRKTLNDKFDVIIAGGFGKMKGKMFRIGCMGEVSDSHVNRTVVALAMTLAQSGYKVDLADALGAIAN
jgi:aspartate aminotransferase-like enzyme